MSREEGERYFLQGENKRSGSNFAEALDAYQVALTHYPEEAIEQRLRCHQKIGDCLRMVGDFAAARESFLRALSLAQEAQEGEDDVDVADVMVGLGLSVRGVGEVAEAQQYLERARGIYEEWEDPEGEAYALWALGGLWRIAGELRRAQQSFEEDEDLQIRVEEENGKVISILYGDIHDQAALHGILSRIRDLGLNLILVKRMDDNITQNDTSKEVFQ